MRQVEDGVERRRGQHSAGSIDDKYADSRNMQGGYNVLLTLVYSWKQLCSSRNKRFSFLVDMHRIIESKLEKENKETQGNGSLPSTGKSAFKKGADKATKKGCFSGVCR